MQPIPFVFVQKTDKFQFVANGMRTIRKWCSVGYTYLVCEPFTSGLRTIWFVRVYGLWEGMMNFSIHSVVSQKVMQWAKK